MVEMLTFMVHRRQELERKEAEEELAQAGGEEQTREEQTREEQLAQTREEHTREEQLPQPAHSREELQAQARAKLGEENPFHPSIPPNKAKETSESGLLPSSKRFKSCF